MRPRHNLGLFLAIVFGMIVATSSRPIQDSDILSGVDFLSMFIHSSSEELSTTNSPKSTTITTTTDQSGEVTTLVEDISTSVPVREFVSNSRRSEFVVEEGEVEVVPEKVKRKSEDLLAIGANPDYIAQQQSRRENSYNYNNPYQQQPLRQPLGQPLRQPLGRSRSVSYSAVVQSLPNSPIGSKSGNNYGAVGTDGTDFYPDYSKKNLSLPSGSTAESKDYYVTRKYNPVEYNESTDKSKKSYEPTERNWGLPEKSYLPSRIPIPTIYGKPEQNYEVDESVSVMSNGRAHGIQSTTEKTNDPIDDSQKVGYVVEGRNYKKYRVEERTSDGFIVGEYGVVSNNDGSLRGVRYTADGTINPRVIYDALMKFLAL